MKVPFAIPDITEAEIEAVEEVLRSRWLTTGPNSKKFEAAFAERVGAKHAIAVNSCTAAMHLALEALGIGPEDEVIVPSLTFAATAEVVRYLGARPVLVDALPGDHTIDPKAVEAAISPRTKAIIPVHFAGQSCDMDALLSLVSGKSIKILEDAAHSFPTSYKGKLIGGIGDITCFSFYATKTLTTGEGGMAVTENDEWADRMRVMSLHGISKDAWKRYTAEGSWYYEIIAPGFKYNLTDMAAALGLVQLERTAEMLESRRGIARAYTDAFSSSDSLELLQVNDFDAHSWHLFVIKIVDDTLTIDRSRFIEDLKERGVLTSVHFIPLHIHPYYRETYGYEPQDLPVSYDCYSRSISLPIFSAMTKEEIDYVCENVTDVLAKFRR